MGVSFQAIKFKSSPNLRADTERSLMLATAVKIVNLINLIKKVLYVNIEIHVVCYFVDGILRREKLLCISVCTSVHFT